MALQGEVVRPVKPDQTWNMNEAGWTRLLDFQVPGAILEGKPKLIMAGVPAMRFGF